MEELKNLNISPKIRDAFLFFSRVSKQRKNDDDKRLTHPEYIACMLSRFENDDDIIAAAILKDVLRHEDVHVEDISELFGNKIADLVYELNVTFNSSNAIDKRLSIIKYFNELSDEALNIMLVTKIHETLSLIDSVIPKDFVKWHIEDISFISKNINRKLTKTHKKLLYILNMAIFYVELTRNV